VAYFESRVHASSSQVYLNKLINRNACITSGNKSDAILAENNSTFVKKWRMVVLSKAILMSFVERFPEAEEAVLKWYGQTSAASWKNFSEMKNSFNAVDAVGNDRYVFNIKGNHFRLIALIIFKVRTVFVLFIGTHKEYDELDASTVQFKQQ
jgi:mRNA interferase HigB